MPVKQLITEARVPVKIFTDDIEDSAREQLTNMAQLPIVHGHVAAMPDVHTGIGATVGSVIATRQAIIPAAVGVDIGCGMNALRLSLTANELPDSMRKTRRAIESAVPVGFDMHKKDVAQRSTIESLAPGLESIFERHPKLRNRKHPKPYLPWVRQLGTLGGGNHFVEVCIDEQDHVWVMLHSGSRGMGNGIGRYFIELARKEMERLDVRLPDKDLAYLEEGTEHFDDYVDAVNWAQDYAMINRREMMRLTLDAIKKVLPRFKVTKEAINCHHNYVTKEHHFGADVWVTRKGAIRAGAGDLGIIPGSMGACSYIVEGRGSIESLDSCAHGAGRRMSRTKAKKMFSAADVEEQTRGVECRKDKSVIDEIPAAYKDIDEVMEHQSDLVKVVHRLRQVVCVKG